MSNLRAETIEILKDQGLSPADVVWVGGHGGTKGTWEDFARLADVEYDNGFGSPEADPDLIVVGPDWWLERHEYDGSEWWEFKRLPVHTSDASPLLTVFPKKEDW